MLTSSSLLHANFDQSFLSNFFEGQHVNLYLLIDCFLNSERPVNTPVYYFPVCWSIFGVIASPLSTAGQGKSLDIMVCLSIKKCMGCILSNHTKLVHRTGLNQQFLWTCMSQAPYHQSSIHYWHCVNMYVLPTSHDNHLMPRAIL